MANVVVNTLKSDVLNGNIDLVNDTIKVMLLDSNHTNDIDAQEFVDDVSANEVSASGTYALGGAALTSKTVTTDDTNDRGVFDAADVTFTSSTITARYAVIYKDTGTPSTSPIVCIFDFVTDQVSTSGDFSIQWNTDGILYIS